MSNKQTAVIDFTKLQTIIPDRGLVTLTFKKNSDGSLSVLFKSRHSLLKADHTNEKDLKDTQEAIEKGAQALDKTVSFSGTPEALTEQFEAQITSHAATARSLAEAINDSTADLNARIKDLRDKKATAKPAAVKKTEPVKKEVPQKEGKPAGEEAGLFGTISASGGPKEAPSAASSKASEDEGSGRDESEEV